MAFEKLRKLKPEIKDANQLGGSPDPRFKVITTNLPAKWVSNTKSDMNLLDMYARGVLKNEDIGKVCGQCVWYYPDPHLKPQHGRCRAYGFKEVHEELSAEEKQNYTEPDGQFTFGEWPGCPTWTSRERTSRG